MRFTDETAKARNCKSAMRANRIGELKQLEKTEGNIVLRMPKYQLRALHRNVVTCSHAPKL